MKLAIGSIASGSSGNCYIIKSETTNILVDAGVSAKRICEGMEAFGVSSLPDAILLTHEHSDHICGLPTFLKKEVDIFASCGTICGIEDFCEKQKNKTVSSEEIEINPIAAGESFVIGDIEVSSFAVSHDAREPLGFSFRKDGCCISVITDTGYITPDCSRYMSLADVLVLESNHDESMLRIGKYPYYLKQRILGKTGHLSNETAARGLSEVLKKDIPCGNEKKRTVLLAHLSRENNFPQMAMATFENVLACEGIRPGGNLRLETLSRTERSALYIID